MWVCPLPASDDGDVAFSMEVGLASAVPTYAGGVLAGDMVRAAAELGLQGSEGPRRTRSAEERTP